MKYINTEKVIIKSWCNDPEEGALEQAKNLANLPFAFKQVCLMPDTHQGFGMPIGGVLATKGVVIPNAVGVDIGCGCVAVKTSLKEIDAETIKKIFGGSKEYQGGIRACVPVGPKHQSKKQDAYLMPEPEIYKFCSKFPDQDSYPVVSREYDSALNQLGTLGGGNHFIEIQKGDDGYIWIMLHSGSRNLGYKVARYHNDIAKELNEKWHTSVPKKWDLAFLPIASEEGQTYLRDMEYCVDFALANRKLMMLRIGEIFIEHIPGCLFIAIDGTTLLNIAHNYASMEKHFGQNVMVHRKGATLARENTIGIIPGSQGTASYIVKGKGNPESFMSCSHGAGRRMSRTKAIEALNLEEEKRILDEKGIVHSIRNKKDLDEAPSAYKDIEEVISSQLDLIEPVVKLTPLAVIKG